METDAEASVQRELINFGILLGSNMFVLILDFTGHESKLAAHLLTSGAPIPIAE